MVLYGSLKIKWKFEHESFWNGGILALVEIWSFKVLQMENLLHTMLLMEKNCGQLTLNAELPLRQ